MGRRGRPPIGAAKLDQIDELLLAGLWSLREIAERATVGVGTVERCKARLAADGRLDDDHSLAPHERRLWTPIRCTGECGGLIEILPCRACRALRLIASERAARELGLLPPRPPVQQSLLDEPDLPPLKPVDLRGKFAPLLEHFEKKATEDTESTEGKD